MAGVSVPAGRITIRMVHRSVRGLPRRLAAVIRTELAGYRHLPAARVGIPVAALAAGVVFGGLRPGIERFYPESAPFLLIALAAGILGRTPALLLSVGYAAGDAVRFVPGWNGQWPVMTGRITGWIVLWVLAGAVPLFARRTAASLTDALRDRSGGRALPGLQALAGAGLLFVAALAFMQAMAYLLGSAYAARNPSYADVVALQELSPLIAGLAALLHLAVALVIRPRIGELADAVEITPTFPQWSVSGVVARLVLGALAVFLVQAFIADQLDVVLLAGALVGGEVVAFAAGRVRAISRLIRAIPELVRAGVGVALGATVGVLLFANWGPTKYPTEYFPFVVGLALGIFVLRVLWSADPAPDGETSVTLPSVPAPVVGAGVVTLVTVGWLALPSVVSADNCTGLVDCIRGALNWAWGALAAAAAFFWNWAKGVFGKFPPVIGQLEPLASEEGAAAEQGGMDLFQDTVSKRAAGDGQMERAQQIKDMSSADFYRGVQNGDFSDLGVSLD